MPILLRISTVPLSLDLLLKGQFAFMQQNGFEVFLASSEGKEIQNIEAETGIKVHLLPLKRNISLLNDLRALWATYILIKRIQPDIVHTLTPKAGLIGMMASCLAGVPVRMHTFTGLIFPSKKGLFQKLLILMDQLLCKCATHINPEGEGVKRDLIQYQITSKPLKILAHGNVNGIDLNYYDKSLFTEPKKQDLSKTLNIAPTDFVFTFVGRLVGDKGINELVEAFTQLSIPPPLEEVEGRTSPLFFGNPKGSSFPIKKIKHHTTKGLGVILSPPPSEGAGGRTKLLLVGTEEPKLDPLSSETQRQIKEHPGIITVGWQEDIRPYLAISNAFVFPSYREGMPNVVLQAGAMGLPQIVTDINGSNEIITHGINGIIIPPKQVQALAEAMHLILENESYRHTLSQNARDIIAKRFDQKLVWEALLEEYNDLLSQIPK